METEFKVGQWAILDDAHNDELEKKEGYRAGAFKIDMIRNGLLWVAERDSFRRGFPVSDCRPAAEEEIALAKPWPHTLGEAGRREREMAEYQVGGWAILKKADNFGAFEIKKIGYESLGIEKDGVIELISINHLRHATPLEITTALRANAEEFQAGEWAILKEDHESYGAFKIDSIREVACNGAYLFEAPDNAPVYGIQVSLCRHAAPEEVATAKEKAAKERFEAASAENEDDPTNLEIEKMRQEIHNLKDYQRHAVAEMKRLNDSLGPYEIEMEILRTEREELNHALIKSELKVRGLSAELEGVKNKTSTMGRWNYRVVKRDCKATRDGKAVFDYGIYETHYDNDGQPNDMTVEPNRPEEESIEALRATMEMMTTALDKPVLNYDEIGEE